MAASVLPRSLAWKMNSSNPVEKLLCFAYKPPERLLWIPRPLPCQGKIQPDRMGSFLLYLPAEDSNTRHVLCPCDDSESASDPRGSGGSGKRMGSATEKQEDFPDTSE